MDIEYIIALVIYSIACGFFSSKIAEQKGYNKDNWFFAGFLFNIAGIIAIGFYEKKEIEQEEKTAD